MGVTYRFRAVSGGHHRDCHLLASRHHEELGTAADTGEFYVLRSHGGALHVLLRARQWLTALWRSPGGRVFVTGADGTVWSAAPAEPGGERWTTVRLPAVLGGVWGLHDDLVFAAGTRAHRPVLFRLSGQQWAEVECPGYVTDIRFFDERVGVLCGDDGLLAGWDGDAWKRLPSPASGVIHRVAIASPGEMYAQAGDYGILEGSVHGWVELARLYYVMRTLAWHGGRLWVSVHGHDLCHFADGVLTPREPGFPVTAFDTRERLVAMSGDRVASSEDGEGFESFGVEEFVTLARREEPWWMADPELRDLGDEP